MQRLKVTVFLVLACGGAEQRDAAASATPFKPEPRGVPRGGR
jgi:hypothetical protein